MPTSYHARRPVWVRPAVVVLCTALTLFGAGGLVCAAIALTMTLSITQADDVGPALASIGTWLVVGVVVVLASFERSRLVAVAVALAITAAVLFAVPQLSVESPLFRQVGLQACLLLCATVMVLSIEWQGRLRSEAYWRLRSVRRLECPFCGYSLVRAASTRCPECGGPLAESLAGVRRSWRAGPGVT